METDILMPLLMRWIHMLTAAVLLGGLVFYRFVFVPIANRVMSQGERERLREPLMRRWKLYVHPPIVLFLISGFYNYLAVTRHVHEDQPLYHMLFGVKFLLAICVFALAITVTSTMAWSARLRTHSGLWALLVFMTAAVVLIGGYMKVMPTTGPASTRVEAGETPVPEWPGNL